MTTGDQDRLTIAELARQCQQLTSELQAAERRARLMEKEAIEWERRAEQAIIDQCRLANDLDTLMRTIQIQAALVNATANVVKAARGLVSDRPHEWLPPGLRPLAEAMKALDGASPPQGSTDAEATQTPVSHVEARETTSASSQPERDASEPDSAGPEKTPPTTVRMAEFQSGDPT